MKKTIVFLFTLIIHQAICQTIRIADNNPNAPTGANIYTTIQAAVDAAVAGDIVYVQPSPTNYGPVIINKQINLRGIGFYNSAQPFFSKVGAITLTNRLDNTSNASGTIIEGLYGWETQANINLGILTGAPYTLQNITIVNCNGFRVNRTAGYQAADNITIRDSGVQLACDGGAAVSNLLIIRCFLYANFYMANKTLTNIIISNNVFHQDMQIHFSASTIVGGILANNIFLGGTSPSGSSLPRNTQSCCPPVMTDWLVTNNIFYGLAPTSNNSAPFERNTYTNNISVGTTNNALPPTGTGSGNTGSGNKVGQDPLFVNAPFGNAYTGYEDFNLQAGSPAKNAGFDGTDIGITGGGYPAASGNVGVKPSSIPVITVFTPAGIVPQNQPVKTNIKAKSN
jgi:hypothetical protein